LVEKLESYHENRFVHSFLTEALSNVFRWHSYMYLLLLQQFLVLVISKHFSQAKTGLKCDLSYLS